MMKSGIITNPWQIIVRFLPPEDWLNMRLVSRGFNGLLNQPSMWQHLIAQHFPYLIPPENLEDEDLTQRQREYKRDPRTLFINQYNLIKELALNDESLFELVRTNVLASLRGDFKKIPLNILYAEGIIFFGLAASNGHQSALINLHANVIPVVFALAASVGNYHAVSMMLNEVRQHIGDGGNPLVVAAEFNSLEIAQLLLSELGHVIPSYYLHMALNTAARHGHVDMVNFLLSQVLFTSADVGLALTYAASHGQICVVNYLLNSKCYIDKRYFKESFQLAVSAGHVDIAGVFLYSIDSSDIQNAVWVAFRKGHTHIIHLLLKSDRIDENTKINLLCRCSSNWHEPFMQLLLTQIAHEDGSVRLKVLNRAATTENETALAFYLEKWGQELSFYQIQRAIGFSRACQYWGGHTLSNAYHAVIPALRTDPHLAVAALPPQRFQFPDPVEEIIIDFNDFMLNDENLSVTASPCYRPSKQHLR